MPGKKQPTLRHLVLVLGDQLDAQSSALDGFDPAQDAIWMAEVAEESTHVPSSKQRIAVFLSAMRHFADEIRQRGWRIHYRQLDGAETLTVLEREAKRENARQLLVEGDIWVAAETYTPLRITLHATSGEGEKTIAEEAEVNYKTTPYGSVLPTSVAHRELRAGRLVAENNFVYAEFHKFAASSDIKFEVLDEKP